LALSVEGADDYIKAVIGRDTLHRVSAAQHVPFQMMHAQIGDDVFSERPMKLSLAIQNERLKFDPVGKRKLAA